MERVFGELSNAVLEENGEDKMVRENTNEQVLQHIGENRTLPNKILRSKVNWIGNVLRKNCLHHDAIEGQMKEVKGVRRRTKLLDDLRNKKIFAAEGES